MNIPRVQPSFGMAPDEASFINMHHLSTSLIFIILFGIVVLATLSLYIFRSRHCAKHAVEVEPHEQTPLESDKGEASYQPDRLAPGSTHVMSASLTGGQDLVEVALKMRELVELSQRLKVATQTFDHHNAVQSRKVETVANSSQTRRYLPFFLGDEVFAVSIRTVKEVVEADRLIIERGRPNRIRRAINLRGSVVPVIDLSRYLGGEPTEINQCALIVVLVLDHGAHPRTIGVKVDALCAILNIAPSSIVPPPIQPADIRSGFVIGTLQADKGSITVLDIGRGLSMGARA
ncbi:chemotaxis protein CheW [Pseudomonas batumici]|uniref:chemotaxis protein CheW n=1 Tax=Pseudomonas batumici TaxID=226910 RepID=UPI0030D31F83